MIKKFCDACGEATTESNGISIPCHLYSKRNELGYVDSNMNRVSGRNDVLDLCNACNNQVFSAAVEKLREIQKGPKHGVD